MSTLDNARFIVARPPLVRAIGVFNESFDCDVRANELSARDVGILCELSRLRGRADIAQEIQLAAEVLL